MHTIMQPVLADIAHISNLQLLQGVFTAVLQGQVSPQQVLHLLSGVGWHAWGDADEGTVGVDHALLTPPAKLRHN